MAERTPTPDGIDAALWRGGIGDGAEARRASSLYVAMFLLWPLAAIVAGLVSLLLAWFGRAVAQVGFLITFGVGLVAPFAWQWWERSLWRTRRRAARVGSFLPLSDLSELAMLADGQPVRVRGRVRPCSAFAGAASPPGAPALVVYEQVQARAGVLGPALWYELGCDFEVVCGEIGHSDGHGPDHVGEVAVERGGQCALVRVAGAQVLARRVRRVRLHGRDAVERVLERVPVSGAVGAGLGRLAGTRMAARTHAIQAGDQVEILACKLPPDHRAALPRASALRPAIGAYGGIAPLVIVLDRPASP